jgi:hypothetical protein
VTRVKSTVRNFSQLSSTVSRPPPNVPIRDQRSWRCCEPSTEMGCSMASLPEDITEPALEPQQRPATPRRVFVVSVPDPTACTRCTATSRIMRGGRPEPGQAQCHDNGRPPSISGSRGVLVAWRGLRCTPGCADAYALAHSRVVPDVCDGVCASKADVYPDPDRPLVERPRITPGGRSVPFPLMLSMPIHHAER